MTAAVSPSHNLLQLKYRMSDNPGDGFGYAYDTSYADNTPSRSRPPQRSRIQTDTPQYSLDFLDTSAREYSAAPPLYPIAAIPTYHGITPVSPTYNEQGWHPNLQGHARSISASNFEYYEGEQEDEDDGSQEPQSPVITSAEASTSTKRKMKRFRLTHTQTRFLMDEFLKQPHPDAAHREHLSKLIPGLSSRQVQIWFQNRRAKLKRLPSIDRERLERQRSVVLEATKRSHPPHTVRPSTDITFGALSDLPDAPQASTASLFARLQGTPSGGSGAMSDFRSSTVALESRSTQPNLPSSDTSGRRKAKARQALVFGWDLSVYVDESGSEFEDDGASIVSSERSQDDEQGFAGDSEHVQRVPTVEVVSPSWSMPPSANPQTTSLRRASIHGGNRTISPTANPQRPMYTSTPSWPAPK